jgi:hypothetical protein
MEWARARGVHPQTAYRWFREGALRVPAVRVDQRSVLVSPDTSAGPGAAAYGLCARRVVGKRPDVSGRPGMVLVHTCNVAGFFDGYTYRIAAAEERASIARAAALARAASLNASAEPGPDG